MNVRYVLLSLVFVFTISFSIEQVISASAQETPRAIVSDDFTKARPKSKKPPKTGSHSGRKSRQYHLSSTPLANAFDANAPQVGLTIWKVERAIGISGTSARRPGHWQWLSKRVAADARFKEGDLIRLSIESPRAGYLYVINRDLLADGSYGATNLIFPARGEDNRLEAGKLIDIPAEDQPPLKASPGENQAAELLTILLTSTELPLPLSDAPLPISPGQLLEWEERWSGFVQRFELDGGVGQARTAAEQEAASRKRSRQLTRADPAPQTIFLLNPKSNDGLLFNLLLSYVR